MAEFGDRVKFDDQTGIFIKSDDDFNVIKLDSGYNLAVPQSKKLKVISKSELNEIQLTRQYKNEKGKKQVLILHTGGTIASKVDYKTGGVVSRIKPEELLNMFGLMYQWCNFDTKLLSAMYSEDMRFDHYNLMAKEIQLASENGYDAVVITHGTDTMHYTSSALSFMFEDLNIPVVLVGSQRSSDRGSSDAYINMAAASKFISQNSNPGVYICMHKDASDEWCHVLSGVNVKKLHTSKREAFQPINNKAIAEVNPVANEIKFIEEYNYFNSKETKYQELNSKLKIGILFLHPNMHLEEFEMYSDFDALIITALGIGQAPINHIDDFTKSHKKIYATLKKLSKKIPVVFTAQTVYGRLNQNVYSTGRMLKELNVAGHMLTITTETAFSKLAYLLSKKLKVNKVLEEYNQNLKGEIVERL